MIISEKFDTPAIGNDGTPLAVIIEHHTSPSGESKQWIAIVVEVPTSTTDGQLKLSIANKDGEITNEFDFETIPVIGGRYQINTPAILASVGESTIRKDSFSRVLDHHALTDYLKSLAASMTFMTRVGRR